MSIVVAISTVADGSMLRRGYPSDTEVIKNRTLFLKTLGIQSAQTTRLKLSFETSDFCRYAEVASIHKGDGMDGDFDTPLDAIVTTKLNHALFLPIADCVGAVFYDPIHQILGLAHLGRHSLEQRGGEKFVMFLQDHYHCHPKDIKVWLSPAPGKDIYPIWALDNKGMKEVTFEQLYAAGILDENITDNPAETDKDHSYFSYSEFLKSHRDTDGDHAIVAIMRI